MAKKDYAFEIEFLEKQMAKDAAKLAALKEKAAFKEFPKAVTHEGQTLVFENKAQQDAAGADFADPPIE